MPSLDSKIEIAPYGLAIKIKDHIWDEWWMFLASLPEVEPMSDIFQPLFDRILVKRVVADSMYKGIIVIPEIAKDKPQEGEVVSLGTGKGGREEEYEFSVKPGDKILFGKYSGSDIKIEGVDYVIMREEDVLGVLR